MAATRITPTTVLGSNTSESAATQLTIADFAASDATNGNVVTLDTDILLGINNSAAGDGTITITGVTDPYGRTNTAITTVTVDGTGTSSNNTVWRKFSRVGWADAAGDLNITTSATTMNLLAIEI